MIYYLTQEGRELVSEQESRRKPLFPAPTKSRTPTLRSIASRGVTMAPTGRVSSPGGTGLGRGALSRGNLGSRGAPTQLASPPKFSAHRKSAANPSLQPQTPSNPPGPFGRVASSETGFRGKGFNDPALLPIDRLDKGGKGLPPGKQYRHISGGIAQHKRDFINHYVRSHSTKYYSGGGSHPKPTSSRTNISRIGRDPKTGQPLDFATTMRKQYQAYRDTAKKGKEVFDKMNVVDTPWTLSRSRPGKVIIPK